MSEIEAKLEAMGLTLPEPWTYPSGNRRGCVRVGPILYLSGHGPEPPDLPGVRQRGKLGVDVGLEEGYATARAVALLMIATLKAEVGDLDKIERVVRLFGMVNSSPDFEQFPAVIDGASDLFYELWGPDRGQHARTAIGAGGLPRGIVVEINGEFEVVD